MTELRAPYAVVQAEHAKITAAEERERLRMAYVLMSRVFLHVSMTPRTEAMRLLRQMHNTISDRFSWPPLDTGRRD